jgi:membrane protein DedA with SNARE-associated domain
LNALISLLPGAVTQHPLPYSFIFLFVFGFTLPICEEIAVALVGVTARATGTPFPLVVAVALAAILLQDTGYFLIARLFGPRLIRHKLLSRIFKPASVEEGELYFSRRGPFIVFSSRFVVGLRAPVIFGAGLLRMKWPRFMLYDSLAAAIMTPAWLLVGFALGAQFDSDVGALTKFFSILAPIAIIAGAFFIHRSVKADKAKADAEPSRTIDADTKSAPAALGAREDS